MKSFSAKIIFILFITIIFSCDKNENINEDQNAAHDKFSNEKYSVKLLSQKNLDVDSLKFIKDHILKISSHLGKSNSENDIIIDLDHIKYVSNQKYSSYNFPVFTKEGKNSYLQNLVLISNDQNSYDTYVINYGFTGRELDKLDRYALSNYSVKFKKLKEDYSNLVPTIKNNHTKYMELICQAKYEEVWTFNVDCYSSNWNDCMTLTYVMTGNNCSWLPGGGTATGTGDTGSTTGGGGTYTGGDGGYTGSGDTRTDINGKPIGPISDETLENHYFEDIFKDLSLSTSDYNWLMYNSTIDERRSVAKFLKENLNSGKAQDFAEEAVPILRNNSAVVDFDNKIILDPTFENNLKVKSIYEKLKSLSSSIFTDILVNTFEGSQNVLLKFDIGPIPNDAEFVYNAKTYAAYNSSAPRFFRIRLKDSFVSSASDMDIAFAIIHEMIHAELLERCIQSGLILNINTSGYYTFQNYGNPSPFTNVTVFNSIVTYYKNLGNVNPQWNHDLFTVLHYRQKIKENLISVHSLLDDPSNPFINTLQNDGVFNSIDVFFDYFSWAGLEGTQAYQNLSPSEKSKVTRAIQLINLY